MGKGSEDALWRVLLFLVDDKSCGKTFVFPSLSETVGLLLIYLFGKGIESLQKKEIVTQETWRDPGHKDVALKQ